MKQQGVHPEDAEGTSDASSRPDTGRHDRPGAARRARRDAQDTPAPRPAPVDDDCGDDAARRRGRGRRTAAPRARAPPFRSHAPPGGRARDRRTARDRRVRARHDLGARTGHQQGHRAGARPADQDRGSGVQHRDPAGAGRVRDRAADQARRAAHRRRRARGGPRTRSDTRHRPVGRQGRPGLDPGGAHPALPRRHPRPHRPGARLSGARHRVHDGRRHVPAGRAGARCCGSCCCSTPSRCWSPATRHRSRSS